MTAELNTDNELAQESFALNQILDELKDAHGKPVAENEHMVVFADRHGHELNEIINYSDHDITRRELSEWMHEKARLLRDRTPSGGDHWATADPVVVLKWNDGKNPHFD